MLTLYKGGDVEGEFYNVSGTGSKWYQHFIDAGFAPEGSKPAAAAKAKPKAKKAAKAAPEPEPAPAEDEDPELVALAAKIEALDSDDNSS